MEQARLAKEKRDREAKEEEAAANTPHELSCTDLPKAQDFNLPKQPGVCGNRTQDSFSPPRTDTSEGSPSQIAFLPPPVSEVPDAKRVGLVFLRRNETGLVDVWYLDYRLRRLGGSMRVDR